jgi:hypothetical protein
MASSFFCVWLHALGVHKLRHDVGPRRAAGSGHCCRLPSLAVDSSVRFFYSCHRSPFLYHRS